MTDDYLVKPRSNQEIRKFANELRAYYGVANAVYIDILDCVKRDRIWTIRGVRRLNFLAPPDNEMGRSDGSTITSKDAVTITVKESLRDAASFGGGRVRNNPAPSLKTPVQPQRHPKPP